MVVEGAEGIWDVETVVRGVEVTVEELVDVEEAMEKVLPGINYKSVSRRLDLIIQQARVVVGGLTVRKGAAKKEWPTSM